LAQSFIEVFVGNGHGRFDGFGCCAEHRQGARSRVDDTQNKSTMPVSYLLCYPLDRFLELGHGAHTRGGD
jgi:hypothetical protein